MKKVALSLLALAVVAAGAFADAPKWDPKVTTEFKGAASVTLGYDIDTGISAFSNDTSVSLIIDLISGGDKSTTSDADVWGEIRIKTDGDPVRIKADDKDTDATTAYDNGFKLQVDFATIHFGKSAYLKVTSKDTKIGYANSPDVAFLGHVYSHWPQTSKTVLASDKTEVVIGTGDETVEDGITYTDSTGGAAAVPLTAGAVYVKTTAAGTYTVNTLTRYGQESGLFLRSAFDSQGAEAKGGAEFGVSLEKVASLSVIVGSTDAWSTALVNSGVYSQIAYKATVGLLAVDNLTLEAGYSSSTVKDSASAYGVKLGYKYAIDGDKLYVKPTAGLVQTKAVGANAKAYNLATAGVLLGTGAKAVAFDNYGLKLDSDYGSYPGVAVGVFYNDEDVVKETNDKKADLGLNLSVNSGALSPDVTLLGAYEIQDLNAADLKSLITIGASGSVKAGDITFSPKGVLSYLSAKDAVLYYKDAVLALDSADSSAFLKITTDVTGIIPFVTFTLNYDSNDLINGYGKKNDKLGKLEFTTKVSF